MMRTTEQNNIINFNPGAAGVKSCVFCSEVAEGSLAILCSYIHTSSVSYTRLVLALQGPLPFPSLLNGPYAKLSKNYSKLLTSRGLGAQCSKHASVLLI